MRPRVSNPTHSRGIAALVAAASLVGCAQTRQPGVAAAPAVASAGSFYRLTANARPLHETRTLSFALDRIDQRQLPLDNTYRHSGSGRGVTVYVFDGGVSQTHPELAGRVRVGYTAFPDDPKICNAHGTAVAGAIAGQSLGVAPDAEIVDVKMVQCDRLRGTIRGIIEGAKWAIQDHKERGGPAIANWSFIADTAARIPALDSAVAELRANGISVVVSAGNVDVNACRISPGNAEGTIVVGASTVTKVAADAAAPLVDRRSQGTAWGPCVDVYAPGDSVLLPSLDKDLAPTAQLWNGTSMSAGYVSGAAALFLEAHPAASPDQVAEFIKGSATQNSVRDTKSPFSRMLFVGPGQSELRRPSQQLRTVAELRGLGGR
jgi:aqualysin 1